VRPRFPALPGEKRILARFDGPVLKRVRQETHEIKAGLGYIARPCLERKKEKKRGEEREREERKQKENL
jgi:hypothetical protein